MNITVTENVSAVTFNNVPLYKTIMEDTLTAVAEAGINIDMISMTAPTSERFGFGFTLDDDDMPKLLCIGALDLFFPFFVESFNEYDGAFFSLMNSSNTAPALVLWSVFDFSFSTGMWAVSGLALSAVFPDIFVAFCAPVIMNYLLEFVSFEVDFFPDLLALSLTHTDISDNRAICAVYIISALTLLTVVFAFIFSKAAGRRIRNEMR